MTSDLRERLNALSERRVSADEVRRALTEPASAAEREDVAALVRWFTARYRTPLERLRYVRRAFARWQGVQARRVGPDV
jgi:hypothetical protein